MNAEATSNGDRLAQSASKLLSEWAAVARAAANEAEKFVREQPVAASAAAFLAGVFLGSVLKR